MANYSHAERMAMAKRGEALPDGSFPIKNAADIDNAIHLVGNASDPARAKAFIIRRARALMLKSKLPLSWL